jgi:hypothetical protein
MGEPPDRFAGNLVGIIVLGVLLTAWTLYYTDAFPAIGGLLALGGLFSWVAFVSKVLTEQRLKALQEFVDRRVFSNPATRRILIAITVVALVAGNAVGSIQLTSVRDGSDRVAWIDNPSTDLPERLSPGGAIKTLIPTWWWAPHVAEVKVRGYPRLKTPVRPWRRVELQLPASFLFKPCVLLHPTRAMMRQRNTELRFQVQIGQQQYSRPFDGHALWLGCEDDVEVPSTLIDAWRSLPGDVDPLLTYWQHPVTLDGPVFDLEAGDVVQVRLVNKDGSPYPSTSPRIQVRAPRRPEDFPQVEELDVAATTDSTEARVP